MKRLEIRPNGRRPRASSVASTRLVVADSHRALREMLATALAQRGSYEVVGHAETGLELVRVCGATRPQLVVMDLLLPELCGVAVLQHVVKLLPRPRILVFTGTRDKALVAKALRCRPDGFVEKSDSLRTLVQAIDSVAAGRAFYTPAASAVLYDSLDRSEQSDRLSGRERQILQMVAESQSSKDISRRLNIALKTVENHRAHLMRKLHLHDVAGLTRYAIKERLVLVD